MKRWLIIGFIGTYLSALSYGILIHTLNFGMSQHPLMYFLVWDMFCGWSAYATRTYVIAEGESRQYYELAPGPWGDFNPWGPQGRQHFDAVYNHGDRLAMNALRHTQHEPMTRIFVIEECWLKKYDVPESVWQTRYADEPRDMHRYCHVRSEIAPDGRVIRQYPPWYAYQFSQMVVDNPRLHAEAQRARPMYLVERQRPGRDLPELPFGSDAAVPTSPMVGAPLGN